MLFFLLAMQFSPASSGGAVAHPSIQDPYCTGDCEFLERLVDARSLRHVLPRRVTNKVSLEWTEGPLFMDHLLFFSDTITAKIYEYDTRESEFRVFLNNSGHATPENLAWMAEPGSNGLALDADGRMLIAQHGARQIARTEITQTGLPRIESLTPGIQLNGPNDIAVDQASGDIFFTDPVYAWLTISDFQDAPYLDDAVRSKGPGFCGVGPFGCGSESGSGVCILF